LFIQLLKDNFFWNKFTKKQVETIEKLKSQLEGKNINLADAIKNLEILNTISNEITSSLNLDKVMNLIYKNVNSLMDVSFFLISTYDLEEESVQVKFCVREGQIVPEVFKTSIANKNSLMALTIQKKSEILINDLEKEYSIYLSDVPKLQGKEDMRTESLIYIPLLIRERVIGLFSVQSKKKNAFTKSDIEILRSLSTVIAVALNNADAYAQLNSVKENLIEQKIIIEEKNKDITDSITYAKRIQQAKLPKKEEIYSALPNCFVLFKPKDIVSGDFYFFHRNNQSVFIAAADCTGHGVPGAFMSMIGSERLEDAVSNSNNTSEILKLLNKGIKTSLRQSDSDESTRDGMDIAICSVDIVNRIVKFAGANRPLYIIRKGQTEIEEIKATKKAIGGLTDGDQLFETHELNFQQGDTFYISTDGYADQFSGQDKKLTTKRFKQILLDIQDKTMQEQETHLDNFIENWKADTEQVDDILVIGVQL
jgi:serine phosphatase RsbU (regulator of sigma subunit)